MAQLKNYDGFDWFTGAVDELPKEQPRLKKRDEIQQLLFAPDPDTGWPLSSMAIVLGKNTAQEVKDYINNYLATSHPSREQFPADDLAFASIQGVRERREQYYERLRLIASGELIRQADDINE